MKSSQELIAALKEFEGCRLEAYKPRKNEKYHTIGYGHYGSDVKKGMVITKQRAEELLAQDIALRERQVEALGREFTQGEFDALVDWVFNFDIDRLKKSTLWEYIRQGKTQLMIIRQFMRWVHSDGAVLPGLVKRRQWEAERYVGKPIYKSDRDLKWYIKKS